MADAQSQSTQPPKTHSGYGVSNSLEGGDSVVEDLSVDDIAVDPVLSFPKIEGFFQPYFDWKKSLNQRFGLQLQLSYQALYQTTNEDVGETNALADRFQIQGAWTLLNRGTKNAGRLTFRLENRNTINSDIPPSQFGFQFGSVAPSGTGFSDFGLALTELAWRQSTFDGRFKFIFGKISAISWYNTHALSSSMRGFQNTALQSSLSKPAPGRGIGLGFGYEINPNLVVVAGVHDANGKTAENPFDTIGQKEFFSSVELRWYTTTPERARYDKVSLQLWHQDRLEDSGTPSSIGATFAASHLFNDRYYAFMLAGVSDGKASIFEKDVLAGVGIAIDTKHRINSDLIAFAVSWGDPSTEALREQTTAEVFYRFQLAERFVITPSIQYVRNPAANIGFDDAWLFGLRTRWTF
ncbi:carbohydrate porin [Tateyamaria sp. Alg231-49]|uniref:carbohydrate porin n=1 Tax=Tateyamaria sp. Alg231-49 TaxID=1922219 RepID=UPI00131EED0E|nr:carbohydrate porin [Tateyamaria sp. Alg231-49]